MSYPRRIADDCANTSPAILASIVGKRILSCSSFDHLSDKRENVSLMVSNGFAWATIELEISKCEVRCVNCHLRKTAREIGIYERKHAFRKISETFVLYQAAA
jgi:hypothetical protein